MADQPVQRRAVVIHPINGTTCTAEFRADRITGQATPDVIDVRLHNSGEAVGYAMFTGGMVLLSGAAIDQYAPLTKPTMELR